MGFRSQSLLMLWIASAIVFASVSCTEGKGSGSGSGGGGGRGGSGGRVGGYYGRGGKGLSTGRKVALGAAVGVAGYAAYKSHHNNYPPHRFHTNSLDNPAFKSGGGATLDDYEDIKIQESSYYNRSEGFGMGAFALIALILGIIALCTLIWYCMEIGLPLWRDRENGYTRTSMYASSKEKEGHPLQETPSTATPSP